MLKVYSYGFFGDLTLGYGNFVFVNFSGEMTGPPPLRKETTAISTRAVGTLICTTDAFDFLKNNNLLTYAKVTASNSTVYNDLHHTRSMKGKQTSIIPYG